MKQRSFRVFILLAVFISVALSAQVARADSASGVSLNFTCTDVFNFGPGTITLDRNNSGSGADNFMITASDGNGVNLRTFLNSLPLGNYVFGDLIFTTAPKANPIMVVWTSLAGNGLPAQSFVLGVGNCPGLPTAGNLKFFTCYDGRLNCEAGAPAALYCRDGGVDIYRVDPVTSQGILTVQITKAQIDAVKNTNPKVNTLIKSFQGLDLYWLPGSKELSFVTGFGTEGKRYQYTWKGCN